MSLADELKRAQSRMDLAKKEQNKKLFSLFHPSHSPLMRLLKV